MILIIVFDMAIVIGTSGNLAKLCLKAGDAMAALQRVGGALPTLETIMHRTTFIYNIS